MGPRAAHWMRALRPRAHGGPAHRPHRLHPRGGHGHDRPEVGRYFLPYCDVLSSRVFYSRGPGRRDSCASSVGPEGSSSRSTRSATSTRSSTSTRGSSRRSSRTDDVTDGNDAGTTPARRNSNKESGKEKKGRRRSTEPQPPPTPPPMPPPPPTADDDDGSNDAVPAGYTVHLDTYTGTAPLFTIRVVACIPPTRPWLPHARRLHALTCPAARFMCGSAGQPYFFCDVTGDSTWVVPVRPIVAAVAVPDP